MPFATPCVVRFCRELSPVDASRPDGCPRLCDLVYDAARTLDVRTGVAAAKFLNAPVDSGHGEDQAARQGFHQQRLLVAIFR